MEVSCETTLCLLETLLEAGLDPVSPQWVGQWFGALVYLTLLDHCKDGVCEVRGALIGL